MSDHLSNRTGHQRHRYIGAAAVVVGTTMLAVLATLDPSVAQERRVAPPQPAAERRVALLIGNDQYSERALVNAVNDAQALGAALREVGFDATAQLNLTRPDMERAIDRFVASVSAGDVALFYYSGHGFQIEGDNYLAPVDFSAVDVPGARYQAYSASLLQERLSAKDVRLAIVILDACRDNPFAATRSSGGGWAAMGAGRGTYIAFATAPGRTASDNRQGRNGLFTANLLDALREPGLDLNEVFDRVRERVAGASGGRQVPWTTSSVIGSFVFRPPAGAAQAAPSSAADLALRAELTLWESIEDSRNSQVFEDYLRQYPQGRFRAAAEDRLATLRAAVPSTSPPASSVTSSGAPGRASSGATPPSNPSLGDRWTSPADGRTMVWIPPGEFQMGSPEWEKNRGTDEALHTVQIAGGFWLDATEVTNAAYQRFVQANLVPRSFHDGDYLKDWSGTDYPSGKAEHPVAWVSWYAARAYCGWAGKRLPTQAEWEYAARAGTTTAYWWGDEFDGTRANNRVEGTVPVGGAPRTNPWGLSDMLGNVWEWTSTLYRPYPYWAGDGREDPNSTEARVVRGGSWDGFSRFLRSAVQGRNLPWDTNPIIGFRCAQ